MYGGIEGHPLTSAGGSQTTGINRRKNGRTQVLWRKYPCMDDTQPEPAICEDCRTRFFSSSAQQLLETHFGPGSTLGRLVQVVQTICAWPRKSAGIQYLNEAPLLSTAELLAVIPHLHPVSTWNGSRWEPPRPSPPAVQPSLPAVRPGDRGAVYQRVAAYTARIRAMPNVPVKVPVAGECILCDATSKLIPALCFPTIKGGGLRMCDACRQWVQRPKSAKPIARGIGLGPLALAQHMRNVRGKQATTLSWDRVKACGLPKDAKWDGDRVWTLPAR